MTSCHHFLPCAPENLRAVSKRTAADQTTTLDLTPPPPRHIAVIACRSIVNPYLQALDPRDQIFEDEEAYVPRKRPSSDQETAEDRETPSESQPTQAETVDNPFLRPAKMPRKRKH